MTRRIPLFLLTLVCLLIPTVVAAQPAPTPAPVPDIPYLATGRPAPFDGFLIRGTDLAQWKLRIEILDHQLTYDVATEVRVAALQVSLEAARTTAVEERLALRDRLWTEQGNTLTRELMQARKDAIRSWYESPTLWFTCGVIVSSILAIALAAM